MSRSETPLWLKNQMPANLESQKDNIMPDTEIIEIAEKLEADKIEVAPNLEDLQKQIATLTNERSSQDRTINNLAIERKQLKDDAEAKAVETMNEAEKVRYEFEKEKAEFAIVKAETDKKQTYIDLVRLSEEKGYNVNLLDYVDMSSKESAIAGIEKLSAQLDKLANEKMATKMATGTQPPNSSNNGSGGNIDNPFSKETLNYTKQQELLISDPGLYEKLRLQATKKL